MVTLDQRCTLGFSQVAMWRWIVGPLGPQVGPNPKELLGSRHPVVGGEGRLGQWNRSSSRRPADLRIHVGNHRIGLRQFCVHPLGTVEHR